MLEANQVVGGSTQVFRRAGNKFEFDEGTHWAPPGYSTLER